MMRLGMKGVGNRLIFKTLIKEHHTEWEMLLISGERVPIFSTIGRYTKLTPALGGRKCP